MVNIHLGSFDAESYWKPSDQASLPQITNDGFRRIISAMDELLFAFCETNDFLFTRMPFNRELKDYLSLIGLPSFQALAFENFASTVENSRLDALSLFGKIYPQLIIQADKVDAYAITSPLPYNFAMDNPTFEIVQQVNSKIYSTKLSSALNCNVLDSKIVSSIDDIICAAEKYNDRFLIKDPYGVSGKGTILIENKQTLQILLRHLDKQQKKKQKILFVTELYANKTVDFSSHFFIDLNGKFTFCGVQITRNSGFAYEASYSADSKFTERLQCSGYFDTIHQVLNSLYSDGYFGFVDVDSMIIGTGEIIPIVEINARKSMGIINHMLDEYIGNRHLKSVLSSINVGVPDFLQPQNFIELLRFNKLLYEKQYASGIIPLSVNTIFANVNTEHSRFYQGRTYIKSVGTTYDECFSLIEQYKRFLTDHRFKVY